jgi:OmpA family protein
MNTRIRAARPAAVAALAMLLASPAPLAAQAQPASAPAPMVLENAFHQNSAVLLPAAKAALDRMAGAMRAAAGSTWEIAGYTSSVGTAVRNLQVSRQRADAVKTYLVSRGVPASSLTAAGYGSRHPVASNQTAAGRKKNMRVEITRLPPPVRQAAAPAAAPVTAAAAPSGASVRANAVPEGEAAASAPAARAVRAPGPATAPKPLPAAIAPHAGAAHAAATTASRPRTAARDRGGFGLGLGWALYNTSYWFYGGGNSRWQAWSQFQASGFYEGRFPLRIATVQTRYRVELRVGTGGASNDVGSGYVGNGASLTNGTLTGGVATTLRLPLVASAGTHPVPYVGLGIDYGYLWGFGDNSGSIYAKGWNERILTFPLVAGVDLRTAHLTISPELRYGILGSCASNLYLPGAGYAMQDNAPTMKGIFVSVSWR